MEYMITYHETHLPKSTFIIQKANQFVINLLRENNNIIADDLQVTLTIKNYNQNATARFDANLISTGLEKTNRPSTKEEKNNICTICFQNYISVNSICTICFQNNQKYSMSSYTI